MTDHLGSNALTATASGAYVTELRYYAYGNTRYNPGSQVTIDPSLHSGHTGQRMEVGVGAPSQVGAPDRGLYFYGARWYDASLARFIQPDTIVPEPGNPQALTLRQATPVAAQGYAYVLNNPLCYTDPTGMFSEEEIMKYLGVKSSRN